MGGGCHVKWDDQERFTEKLIFEWRLDGGCLRKEISGRENSTAEAQGQKHVWPVEPGLEMGSRMARTWAWENHRGGAAGGTENEITG